MDTTIFSKKWLLGFILIIIMMLLLATEAWIPNETVWKNRKTTNTVQIN